MLLGRPWLYDRKVMYNGYLNTYSFTKDGKKITLASLSSSKFHEIKPQNKPKHSDLLLDVSESLLKASQHDFKAFKEWILGMQEEPATSLPTHPVAKTLIQNFCHLFPEENPRVYLLKEISSTTLILFLVPLYLINQLIG